MKRLLKSIFSKFDYKIIHTKYIPKQFVNGTHILKLDFDHVLSKYLLKKPVDYPFTFIQVGAFDGIECDPLRKYLISYNWNGVLLEPQPAPFDKLSKLYKNNPNLLILNAALDKTPGKANLYVVENNTFPEWAKGMASFDKNNILKHTEILPGIENSIMEIEINTITFMEIFNIKSINKLDLLQVDTEGFDSEILYMFPFDIMKPSIIHFECKHIPKKPLENLLSFLTDMGYRISYDGDEDMIALLEAGQPEYAK